MLVQSLNVTLDVLVIYYHLLIVLLREYLVMHLSLVMFQALELFEECGLVSLKLFFLLLGLQDFVALSLLGYIPFEGVDATAFLNYGVKQICYIYG